MQIATWPEWLSQKSLSNKPPAEQVDHVADDDLLRRTRQRVAAVLAARRLDEPALAQVAQDLGGIRRRDAFRLADLGNRQPLALEAAYARRTRQRTPYSSLADNFIVAASQSG